MFDFVRSHTRLFQGLLVLLIFPSFVFFGVQGYASFFDKAGSVVATVGGGDIKQTELDAAHKQQIERMRQQMPGADIKLFDTPEMREQTLDALVRERVLQMAVVKEHLEVPDQRLQRLFATDPQLAVVRKPDGSLNKEFLAAQGMSVAQFEQDVRRDFALRQVLGGVSTSAVPGKTVVDAALLALLDKREVQIERFPTEAYLGKVSPTDAEVEAYYKSHSAAFRQAEQAQIEYVVLDLEALKKQSSVSDEDLQKYYQENASRYTVAEERRASHILIAAAKDAPADEKAKAKALAERLLAEVRKLPSSFAEVAKKNSADPGSAERGGDLDFFAKGAMVKPFEDAAFAMKVGEISNVVESDFGFHIIKLTAVRGGDRKPFDAVRAEITEEVGKQLAQRKYAEAAEQFSNLVYEQSDSLQPALDRLKLVLQTAKVGRQPVPGAKGPLASSKLLDALFSSESIKNKHNTEAVETGPNQLVSARVLSYVPDHVRPLDEVKPQVLAAVRAEQAGQAARKDALARLAAVKLDPQASLGQTLTLSRTETQGLARGLVDAALKADLSKLPVVVAVDLGAEGQAVLKVVKSVPRAAADADDARARPYIGQALAAAESAAYLEALKRRYKVKISAAAPARAAASAATGSF